MEILSEEQKDQLTGLIATALNKPPSTFSEKVSVFDTIRKWIYLAIVGIVAVALFVAGVYDMSTRVSANTSNASKVPSIEQRLDNLEKWKPKFEKIDGIETLSLSTAKKMKEVRPLVRKHEWQVQQGLTNRDLKDKGIASPEFKEDD